MNILRAKGGASVYFEPYASCDLHEQVVHIKADLSQNFTFSRPEISYNGDAPQVLQAEAVILNGGLSRADASAVYYNAASANSYSATLYSADLDLLRSFEVDPGNDERDPDDYIAHLDINGSDDCPEYTDPTLTCEVEDGVNEGEYNATITIEENSELYNNYIWWFGDEEEGSEEEASGAAIAPENNEVMHTYYDPEEGTEFPVILNYQALDNMYAEVEPTVLHEGEAETVCTIPVSEDYIEAYDDNTTTEQGTPVIIDVLSNDDYNGTTPIPYTDVLTELVDEILPAGGTLEPVMDGDDVEAYEFTPDVDFTGDYVFDYKIIAKEDETLEDVATVTITVTPSPVEITLDCLEQADFEADIEYQVNLTLEDSYGAYNPIMQWNIEGVEEPTILTDYDPPIGGYFSHSFGAVGEYEVNAKAFMVPLDLNLDDEIALSEQYQLFDETVTCIFDEEEPEEYEEPDGEEVTIDNDCGIVNINNNSGDDQDNDQDGYVDCSVTTITTTITYNYYGDEPDDEEEPDEEEPDEEEPDEEEPDEEEPDEEEPETEDPDDPEESVEGDIFALGCLTEENYNAYTDVPLTYYYYDFIDEYSTLNAKADDSDLEPVVHGYPGQVFRPTWATTRAEAVKMLAHSMCAYDLYEALGGNIDDLPGITPFSDVPTSLWAHDKVAVFHELGIIQGYDVDENGDEVDGDITFRPHDYVTRGEFVKMLMQAFLLWNPNIDFDPDTYTVETEYETFADISGFEWVAPWAQFGNDMGIFLGYASGDAKPNQDIIRAEALTILHNAGVVLSESEDSLFNEYYGN